MAVNFDFFKNLNSSVIFQILLRNKKMSQFIGKQSYDHDDLAEKS